MKKFLLQLFILFIFIFPLATISFADDIDEETTVINAKIEAPTNLKDEPTLNSRSCIVLDRNTKIALYGKNEKKQVKMASTTKIMTATIVLENSNLDKTVEVSKKAAGTRWFSFRFKNRK